MNTELIDYEDTPLAVIRARYGYAVENSMRVDRLPSGPGIQQVVVIDEDESWESLDEALIILHGLGIKIERVRSHEGWLQVLVAPDTDPGLIQALNRNGNLGNFCDITITSNPDNYQ